MVTQARIVAQHIMTNSVTAAATDDMKVLKKWKMYNQYQKLQTQAENHNVPVNHTYLLLA